MKRTLPVPAVFLLFVLAVVVVAAASTFQRASAAPRETAGPARYEEIGTAGGTAVYALHYQGFTCFIATTEAGSGISINCPK